MKNTIMEKFKYESIGNKFALQLFGYSKPEEAWKRYYSFNQSLKNKMAEIYQKAFGDAPWYEKFKCGECGTFSKTNDCCPNCKNRFNMNEAYPTRELTNKYFPEMLGDFTPGVLIFINNEFNKTIGFSTGGMTNLKDLVANKYDGNELTLNSIMEQGNIVEDAPVFYDNETCIDPIEQSKGGGTSLSWLRNRYAVETIKTNTIVGRSVNYTWLNIKANQLGSLGYQTNFFVPSGDKYQVNGYPRFFYVSKKITK